MQFSSESVRPTRHGLGFYLHTRSVLFTCNFQQYEQKVGGQQENLLFPVGGSVSIMLP